MSPAPSLQGPARPWAMVALVALVTLSCAAPRSSSAASSSSSSSSSGAGSPAEPLRWTLTLLPGGDVDVGAVDTVLCWQGPPPDHVGPENRRALPWLSDLPHVTDAAGTRRGASLAVDDVGIVTGGLPADACVFFSVDVEAAARAIDDVDVAAVAGRAVVGSPDAWLWRPMPWPGRSAGRLVVKGDPASGTGNGATTVAVPFPRNSDGSWRVSPSTFALQCFSALGSFAVRDLVHRGATLHIARIGADAAAVAGVKGGLDDQALDEWLRVAIDDVAVPLGRFPVDEVTVLLVTARGGRPLLSGFLGRGGGTSALFFVGDGPFHVVDDPELLDEDGRWVFTHELAHTLLPPVTRGDGWLNEGVTTWQQEVLPAAAGRRTRAAAAAQLAVGFRTGAARAARDGLTVEDSCRRMDATGSHQHCYWAGARLIEMLAEDLGDEEVFALVRVLHAAGATDAPPRTALALLQEAERSPEPRAAAAARALTTLWFSHHLTPFPVRPAKQASSDSATFSAPFSLAATPQ